MVQPLKFETKEDLLRFSEMASNENYGIYISTSHGMLDARSLLGLFTILGKEVNVVAPDHSDSNKFVDFLNRYSNS